MAIGPIQLLRQATPEQRRTLLAAALGWALDAFDAMLYALVLALLMRDLGMSKTTAGLLGTLTLLASGIGGVLFGFLADRMGRKQALMASILTYSVCSFASGLATSIAMLAAARFVLGLGMGGEWNTGATLVAETWPNGVPRQGDLDRPEFLGAGLCRGRAGGGAGGTVFRMAGGVLCGDPAGARNVVDSARRAGVGNVEGACIGETT
jgi:MFS family permease